MKFWLILLVFLPSCLEHEIGEKICFTKIAPYSKCEMPAEITEIIDYVFPKRKVFYIAKTVCQSVGTGGTEEMMFAVPEKDVTPCTGCAP